MGLPGCSRQILSLMAVHKYSFAAIDFSDTRLLMSSSRNGFKVPPPAKHHKAESSLLSAMIHCNGPRALAQQTVAPVAWWT